MCVCVCTKCGEELNQVVSRLSSGLKKVCPTRSALRAALGQCEVFLCLIAQELPPTSQRQGVDLTEDALLRGVPVTQEQWLRIGAHSKSPWRPTFQSMEVVCRTGVDAFQVMLSGRLKATCEFLTQYEAVGKINRSLRWCFAAYRVEWLQTLVGSFVLDMVDCVHAEPLGGDGRLVCRLLWLPPAARNKSAKAGKIASNVVASGWDDVATMEGECNTSRGGGKKGDGNKAAPDVAQSDAGSEPYDADDVDSDGSVGQMGEQGADRAEEGIADALLEEVLVAEAVGLKREGEEEEPMANIDSDSGSDGESAADLAGELGDALAGTDGPVHIDAPPSLVEGGGGASSGATSSSEAPLPPPADPPLVEPGLGDGAAANEEVEIAVVCAVGTGVVTWYPSKPTDFVAVCRDPRHGSGRRKHRTRLGARSANKGRLVGYMAAWLSGPEQPEWRDQLRTAKDHMAWTPSLSDRQQARAALKTDVYGGAALMRLERPKRDGEGSEPELCP